MKELSIEEKAKRYDEAIKRGLDYIRQTPATEMVTRQDIFEAIFPELKEKDSEGERIRKSIIHLVEQGGYALHKDEADKMIAWLEKQGEQKSADTDNKFIRMRETKPKDISEFLDRLTTVEQEFLWEHIEKVKKVDREEQKPSDKVEPKFKKGQWVVWQNRYYKVNDNGCGYELIDQNGLTTSLEYGTVEESAHLWNIAKDAKDGDVLANKYGAIFINAGSSNGGGTLDCYCYLSVQNEFCIEEHKTGSWFYKEDITPATAKQRDLLFQKMKESGYEWDAKLKQPRKIEQTSAWSEEDESMFEGIKWSLVDLEVKEQSMGKFAQEIAWLKSLKARVQPKQEWSEEDEDTIKFLISHFCGSHCNRSFQFTSDKLITHDELLEKIRNLRPQNRWKPSAFHLGCITDAISMYKDRGINAIGLKEILDELKKLKEE